MNYRHAFHAGNFADVLKHIVLVCLIDSMQKKDKGFMVLDAFAGIGVYDLHSEEASRSPEYVDGIVKLWDYAQNNQLTPLITRYLKVLAKATSGSQRYYAGSPFLISSMIREQDRAIFNELHPEDFKTLQKNIDGFKNTFHKRIFLESKDGYAVLKAKVPPIERRGLIIIDPPFEKNNEFALMEESLKEGIKRFATGVYAYWYANKDPKITSHFKKAVANQGKEVIDFQLNIKNDSKANSLKSTGVIIVNPPFGVEEEIKASLEQLKKVFSK